MMPNGATFLFFFSFLGAAFPLCDGFNDKTQADT